MLSANIGANDSTQGAQESSGSPGEHVESVFTAKMPPDVSSVLREHVGTTYGDSRAAQGSICWYLFRSVRLVLVFIVYLLFVHASSRFFSV